jgi:hypothetical protein
MKKFLRFYLPLLIAISAFGFFTLRYLVENHENVLKCLVGEGKMISPAKKTVIKIDGIELPDAKIFEADGNFYLVTESIKDFDLLILVKSKNDVILPNSGCREVVFSNYLFLADCAKGYFYADRSPAGMDFDPQLKITSSDINFVVPNHKIEIIFKGE